MCSWWVVCFVFLNDVMGMIWVGVGMIWMLIVLKYCLRVMYCFKWFCICFLIWCCWYFGIWVSLWNFNGVSVMMLGWKKYFGLMFNVFENWIRCVELGMVLFCLNLFSVCLLMLLMVCVSLFRLRFFSMWVCLSWLWIIVIFFWLMNILVVEYLLIYGVCCVR